MSALILLSSPKPLSPPLLFNCQSRNHSTAKTSPRKIHWHKPHATVGRCRIPAQPLVRILPPNLSLPVAQRSHYPNNTAKNTLSHNSHPVVRRQIPAQIR
ncbi:hypothetical protein ACP275_06G122600 [Erythranthe tilingii]